MIIHILGSGAYPLRFSNGLSTSILLPEFGTILDAGLGLTALPADYRTDTLNILLSHFHHDHILGLAFLSNVLESGQAKRIRILGDERIKHLQAFFTEPFNPLFTASDLPITMEYMNENFESNGLRVKRKQVKHATGFSNAFVFTDGTSTFGFSTDTTADASNAPFFLGCSVLFHECNYDNARKQTAIKEGHSYPEVIGKLARASSIQKLYLIHTDPRFPAVAKEIAQTFPASEITKDGQIITI